MGGCVSNSERRSTQARRGRGRTSGHSSSSSSTSLRRGPEAPQLGVAPGPPSCDGPQVAPQARGQTVVDDTLPVPVVDALPVPVPALAAVAAPLVVPAAVIVPAREQTPAPVPVPVAARSALEPKVSRAARGLNWLRLTASLSAARNASTNNSPPGTSNGSNGTNTPSPQGNGETEGRGRDGHMGRLSTGSTAIGSRFSEDTAAAAIDAEATAPISPTAGRPPAMVAGTASPPHAQGGNSAGGRGGRGNASTSCSLSVEPNRGGGYGSSIAQIQLQSTGASELSESTPSRRNHTITADAGGFNPGGHAAAAAAAATAAAAGASVEGSASSSSAMARQRPPIAASPLRAGNDSGGERKPGNNGRDTTGERERGGEGGLHGLQAFQRQGSEPLAGLRDGSQTMGSSNAGGQGRTVLAMAMVTGSQGEGRPSERASTGIALR